MKTRISLFIFAFILVSIAYIFEAEKQTFLNQILFLIFPVFAVLTGILAVKIYGLKSIAGKSLLAMTLGIACWAIGGIIWCAYALLNIDPFPSIADVFFLLGYLLVLLGLYMEFKKAQIQLSQLKKSTIILGLLITFVLTVIVFYFGIYMAYDSSVGFLENVVAMSYGIADLILIIGSLFALLMTRAYRGGKFSEFWMIVIAVFVLNLAADILFAIFSVPYTENAKPYIYIDLLWIAGYLLFAYGMLDNYFHIKAIRKRIKNQ